MAQYGLNVTPISRLQGNSVAGALAYILREKLYDNYAGKTFDYSYLKDFIHSEVLIPKNASPAFGNPITLCNAMENAERRYDGRTGRAIWLSLPNELTPDEWKELVRTFANEAFVSIGMCCILAIHDDSNPDDPTKNNPNAHIILTDRPVDNEGFCAKKNRGWNKRAYVRQWRRQWAEVQNRMFKAKGWDVRVSHESLEVQGVDREPTIPLGKMAIALEQKGILTERGNKNRAIEEKNQQRKNHSRYRGREKSRERDR